MLKKQKHKRTQSKLTEIPDHPIGVSGSGQPNTLLNLKSNQPNIDESYLYAKDLYEAKYPLLINKRETVGLNNSNNPKNFFEYSSDINDIY